MEPRDRILGSIARETGTVEGPAVVDFGELVRRLVLFDQVIVESANLKEPGPIAQKLGYDGARALFDSGRLQLVKDRAWIADLGRAPRKQGPLPTGSYAISPVRMTPPSDFVSTQLRRIDNVPGMKAKHAKKLRHLVGTGLVVNPDSALRRAQEQIACDFEAVAPILKVAIAAALARRTRIELDPSAFELRLEPLGGHDWRAETNLADVARVQPQEVHDVVGQGLAVAATLNIRVALMQEFSALSGLQVHDLPIFEEKLASITRELDPEVQRSRYNRVIELTGLPDVSNDPTVRDLDMVELLEITSGAEVRDFREWLRTTDSLTDEQVTEAIRPVRDALGRAVRGRAAKAVRFATTTGIGMAAPPVGLAVGALDAFVLEELLPRPGPTAFLSQLSGSVFQAP
ncbi:MAG TPA: hypothetical protein VF549_21065 [Solirubrobacteraceae bacterium]|jgi:hypothetical protein